MVKRPAKKHLQSIPIEAMQSVSVPCDDKFSEMEFIVEGDPVGKQRPRFNGRTRTTYTPRKTKHYETLIRNAYEDTGGSILDGYISLSLDVYFAIPKSYTKEKRLTCEHNINRPDKKPDIDNILKIVLDGLNGVAYADDKQVIEVRCRKFYSVSSGYLKVSVSEVKA